MIQDIQQKLDNSFAADEKPDGNSVIFHFDGKDVLYKDDPERPFPLFSDFIIPDNIIYLFRIGDRKFFLLRDSVVKIPDGYSYENVNNLRKMPVLDYSFHFALATAFHLSQWYITSVYCGKCGGINVDDRKERALKCTFCGKITYPRINPAVIVGVTDGSRLLITRYSPDRGTKHDSLIAGFTEIGETLEETVKREVMEEVGLTVKNIRYYKSQPWGASQSILVGFYCDVDGSTEITLDTSELSCAEWVERDDIKGQPDSLSLTNEMMINFRNNNCQ